MCLELILFIIFYIIHIIKCDQYESTIKINGNVVYGFDHVHNKDYHVRVMNDMIKGSKIKERVLKFKLGEIMTLETGCVAKYKCDKTGTYIYTFHSHMKQIHKLNLERRFYKILTKDIENYPHYDKFYIHVYKKNILKMLKYLNDAKHGDLIKWYVYGKDIYQEQDDKTYRIPKEICFNCAELFDMALNKFI